MDTIVHENSNDNSYLIDQKVNAVYEVSQLTASSRYYGHHRVPAQLNQRQFNDAYLDYFVYDD